MATGSASNGDSGSSGGVAVVTLWSQPVTTLSLFALFAAQQAKSFASWLRHHQVTVLITVLVSTAIGFAVAYPGPYVDARDDIVYHSLFIAYWIALGVMSSVGLGSGLHTFLLFLGPHIIRVTIRAGLCDSVDFTAEISGFFPHTSYTEDAWECVTTDQDVSFIQIVRKVWWAAFLWGLGTAIGELPPYFMARAARLSGEKLKELQEIEEEEGEANLSLLERGKVAMHAAVQRFGFWAILLAASIPNPLFDLAGITCGHFLIPFWTFFGATAVGKAVIKVSLQSLFYVIVFSPKTLDYLRSIVPLAAANMLAKAKTAMSSSMSRGCWQREAMDACYACCDSMFPGHHGEDARANCSGGCGTDHAASNWVAAAWNLFIGGMLLWFLASIVTASANEVLAQQAASAAAASQKSSQKKAKAGASKKSTKSQ